MASFVSPSSSSSIAGLLLFVIASFLQGLVVAAGVTFTFTNRCGGTVWPGVLANSGRAPLETTGFALGPGEARSLAAPAGWSGRFWARTGCAFDGTSGGKCATGDCGSGEAECHGSGATPPATLVEFTLGGGGKEDYYDVSLVDGYNVPVVVEPSAAGCPATGCLVDLNERCPPELRAAEGCRSACEAFDRPEYCCSGAFGGPDTCRPSAYSQAFKAACPRAYSYAYDDATSTFTCAGSAAYSVTFCPRAGTSSSSLKSSNDPLPRPGDVVAGAQVAADTWLASLATGESDAAADRTAAAAALRAALAAAAVALLVSSL
ncbi:thaumatin-like protein 1 [Triticum dicoccoides]|uniref:thaumatin-like protein 1 n=1 Tax=Triticum dicoccoides TaxID=85692 RepID=UPI00188F0167|nr:thaumatin-like protein 1 [Triticum dicoccoides]